MLEVSLHPPPSLPTIRAYSSDELPRLVWFTATDEDEAISSVAAVRISFEAVDTPPLVDLNGPSQPGLDTTVSVRDEPVFVRVR